jgi:hypothetical protein
VGRLPRLQLFPIRHKFVLVQLRPGFDQSVLAARESTTNQLNGVNAINTDSLLVATCTLWEGAEERSDGRKYKATPITDAIEPTIPSHFIVRRDITAPNKLYISAA